MKIVVIGGTGLIGSKLVDEPHARTVTTPCPRRPTPASTPSPARASPSPRRRGRRRRRVELAVVRGRGGARVLRDSTRNILDAEAAAGVGHHVALSVVGTDRLPDSGYMRAKVAQEKLIKSSSIPYSIVHATQFFEFATRIADDASDGDTVRVPPVLIQPMAADDVAAAVCDVALGRAAERHDRDRRARPLRFEDFVRQGLRAARGSACRGRRSSARYFGAQLSERTLVPGDGAAACARPDSRTGSASGTSARDHLCDPTAGRAETS